MTTQSFPERRAEVKPLLFRIFFFGAFGFLLYQFLWILSPFVSALVVAVTLALVFYPLHAKILSWVRGRENVASATTVTTLFLMVVIPTIFLVSILGQQAARLYPWAQEQIVTLRANPQAAFDERLPDPLKKGVQRARVLLQKTGLSPRETFMRGVEATGRKISNIGATFIKNILLMSIQTLILAFTLFFLFRDGPRLTTLVVDLIPMESADKNHILGRLNDTLTAVVRGMFVTATVQGLLAGIGFTVVGVPFSVLFGFATVFFALIPLVGAATVWVPLGVVLIILGNVKQGVFVLAYGTLVISSVDNILRPLIVGSRAKLPIALLFFGTLGGLQVYGPLGLLIGPLVVASVLAFTKIYAEQLARAMNRPSVPPPPAPDPVPTTPP